jgi:hypothetical protein
VRVPAYGEYGLWARKFWKHGPFHWRFDRKDWATCGRDVALADSVPIRTHLCVNWVFLGKVALAKGTHLFEVRLGAEPGESLTAAFDCFLLAPSQFLPRGRLRPGERSGRSEPGWWAFEPSADRFGKAELDLRHLNEKYAGISGFVRRDVDSLALGSGRRVKFWGVNCGPGVVDLDPGSVDYLARRLARSGVNLVRYHGAVFDRTSSDPSAVDAGRLDRLHYFVSAMKREGIYTSLSFYFPLWFRVRPEYGLPGYGEGQIPFALLFFDPRMQQIHRGWAKTLLATRNPYTGRPLAMETAVAMVEIVNEDSYLFHTFKPGETIPDVQTEKLERAFGAWLAARHGSVAGALEAWDGARRKRDAPDQGRAELLPAWNLTRGGHGRGALRRRASDQLRFLVEHQRAFFADTARFLKEDLECGSLISCGNWKTADPRLLDALERYTYTAGDVIDEHGYFGGPHRGEGASYQLRVGHTFEDRPAVLSPRAVPLFGARVEGWPHMISEIGWTNPNRYRADFPFLCAAYGSLSGLDALCFFAVSGPGWDAGPVKFPLNVPTVLGQFPACALAYRRGYVREAIPVFREVLDLDALHDFRGTTEFDPLAPLVGRVLRTFPGAKKPPLRTALGGSVDREAGIVTSANGELAWDHGRGVVTVDAPRCQGATGFLSRAGRIELGDVVIESENEYGSILVVPLDEVPLSDSRRILIQAVTEEKPNGWRTDGDRIADLGGYPLMVRDVRARVTFRKGTWLEKVLVLDAHGHERERLAPWEAGKDRVLELPRDALYTVVR